jgi:methylenetetrahydrofolate reductase (NADPH)
MADVRTFSFEFFPPRTPAGKDKLRATWQQLGLLKPKFFSVTFGAGGSTKAGTLETVLEIGRAGFEAAPHISCVASTRAEIGAILEQYKAAGIRHIVALRGDLPSGVAMAGELRHASELVAFIREKTGDWFNVEVACYPEYHPQTRYAADEVKNFRKKVDAGANAAITQYFFNADAYFRFVDECVAGGIRIPIVAGIMPIGNFAQLARFSDACGAEIPRWMRIKFEGFYDDSASIRAFGLDVVTALCEKLLAAGAPGLHFYTLNQAALTTEVWQRLGLSSRDR